MPLHLGAWFLTLASNAGSRSCCLHGCRILGTCFTESSFIDVIAQLCIALKPSILFSKLTLNNFHLNDDSLMRVRKKRKKPACTTLSLHILCSVCLLAPPFPTTTLASFAKTLAWTPTTECWSSFSCPFIIQNRFPSFYFVSCPPVAINDTDSSLRAEPH